MTRPAASTKSSSKKKKKRKKTAILALYVFRNSIFSGFTLLIFRFAFLLIFFTLDASASSRLG